MSSPRGSLVAVVGTRNWLGVAAHLLRLAGLDAREVDVDRKWLFLRAPLSAWAWRANVAHMVWGGELAGSLVLACLMRKKLVWHWIGSDLPRYANSRGLRGRLRRHLARKVVVAHLADSPELAQELEEQGIQAMVCRLLPSSIVARPLPLPDKFRVLSYWFDDRRSFYGGDLVLELARQMPDVEFRIVGAQGRGPPEIPNVRYLGRLPNLDRQYADATALVRLPQHDSLSAMVLEALARGRYVVYNKRFPGCHFAVTLPEVRRALEDIRTRTGPNVEGAGAVRSEFSLQKEADALARAYQGLLTGRARRGPP